MLAVGNWTFPNILDCDMSMVLTALTYSSGNTLDVENVILVEWPHTNAKVVQFVMQALSTWIMRIYTPQILMNAVPRIAFLLSREFPQFFPIGSGAPTVFCQNQILAC